MTIQELLVKLNNKFEQLHQDFSNAEIQQKNLDSKYVGIINSIKSKYQLEYDKQNQLKELDSLKKQEDFWERQYNEARRAKDKKAME